MSTFGAHFWHFQCWPATWHLPYASGVLSWRLPHYHTIEYQRTPSCMRWFSGWHNSSTVCQLTYTTSSDSLSGHLYFVCQRAQLKPLHQYRSISPTLNANVPVGGVSFAATHLDTNVPMSRHWTHGVSYCHHCVPAYPSRIGKSPLWLHSYHGIPAYPLYTSRSNGILLAQTVLDTTTALTQQWTCRETLSSLLGAGHPSSTGTAVNGSFATGWLVTYPSVTILVSFLLIIDNHCQCSRGISNTLGRLMDHHIAN